MLDKAVMLGPVCSRAYVFDIEVLYHVIKEWGLKIRASVCCDRLGYRGITFKGCRDIDDCLDKTCRESSDSNLSSGSWVPSDGVPPVALSMPLKLRGCKVPGMIRDKLDYDSISLFEKKK